MVVGVEGQLVGYGEFGGRYGVFYDVWMLKVKLELEILFGDRRFAVREGRGT